MPDPNAGRDGISIEGSTRYPLESAPVVKHGGNEAIHDGVVSDGGKGYKSDDTAPGFGE